MAVSSVQAAKFQLELYDTKGRRYYRGGFRSDSPEEHIYQINLSGVNVPEGVYLIRIASRAQGFSKIIKLIKGR